MVDRLGNASAAGGLLLLAVIVSVVAGTAIGGAIFFSHRSTDTCTVESKEQTIEVTSDEDGNTFNETVWWLYTDCGVVQIRQQPLLGVWTAAELYGRAHVGEEVELDTVGTRVEILGWYPQVLAVR